MSRRRGKKARAVHNKVNQEAGPVDNATLMRKLEDAARQAAAPEPVGSVRGVPLTAAPSVLAAEAATDHDHEEPSGRDVDLAEMIASSCARLGNALELQGFARQEAVYLIGTIVPVIVANR